MPWGQNRKDTPSNSIKNRIRDYFGLPLIGIDDEFTGTDYILRQKIRGEIRQTPYGKGLLNTGLFGTLAKLKAYDKNAK